MGLNKTTHSELYDLCNKYIDYSATSRNYQVSKEFYNYLDEVILMTISYKKDHLSNYQIKEFRQDIHISVFEKLIKNHHFKKVNNLVAFLYRMIMNRYINFKKKQNYDENLKQMLMQIEQDIQNHLEFYSENFIDE